jgi:hypothetical protein
MFPLIGLGLAAVGTGLSIFGSMNASSEQQQAAEDKAKAAQLKWQGEQEIFKGKQDVYGYQQENFKTLEGVNADIRRGQDIQYAGQQDAVAAQRHIVQLQQQQEEQRRQAMELDATRRMRQEVRQSIAANSMNLVAATAQGAAFGSGRQGAMGAVSGRTGVNLLGISQNRDIARNIFNLTGGITQDKYAQADALSKANEGQSIINAARSTAQESANTLASRTGLRMSQAEAGANSYLGQANDYEASAARNMSEANYYSSIGGMGQGLTSLGGVVGGNVGAINSLWTYFNTPTQTPVSWMNSPTLSYPTTYSTTWPQ